MSNRTLVTIKKIVPFKVISWIYFLSRMGLILESFSRSGLNVKAKYAQPTRGMRVKFKKEMGGGAFNINLMNSSRDWRIKIEAFCFSADDLLRCYDEWLRSCLVIARTCGTGTLKSSNCGMEPGSHLSGCHPMKRTSATKVIQLRNSIIRKWTPRSCGFISAN